MSLYSSVSNLFTIRYRDVCGLISRTLKSAYMSEEILKVDMLMTYEKFLNILLLITLHMRRVFYVHLLITLHMRRGLKRTLILLLTFLYNYENSF